MKQNTVKLNESQLKKIVAESVKRVLKEGGFVDRYFEPGENEDGSEDNTENIKVQELVDRYPLDYKRALQYILSNDNADCNFGLWWDMSQIDNEEDAKLLWQGVAHLLLSNKRISYNKYAYAMHTGHIGDF